ncbi:ATP12 family chaperone protein [Zavarzinia compransoris]|uniref:ATPase n=1 Tax=Zavarzinia compransoris TaxID=1264899 RepID=A0A317DTM6_9PROT|nr:ATP12 family protein [Zavarzinia compransoris]PWR18011.1 ATPase [Zavarzinia compransoris]TDP43524.1 chaperone required for assembly of F1-ATPase [Zavarzinia compransoris]
MKRFWKQAEAVETAGGFAIALDGKPMRSPAKRPLVVPTRALAEAIAAEWNEQPADFKAEALVLTRYANTAVDRVADLRPDVVAELAHYAGTDLLCYRAVEPDDLVARQAAAWDPWIEWAGRRFDLALRVTAGLMPIAQDAAVVARMAAALDRRADAELAALHTLVGILGSLVLALAVAEGELALDDAWQASRVDDDYQTEKWGEDAEAADRAARQRADLGHAHRFFGLLHA